MSVDFFLPNRPRINVNWYEALAFCRWLSTKIGFEVCLPTEAEWEKAARGTDGRQYPWGNEFDAERCNARDTGIGQTSTVGMFPLPGNSKDASKGNGPWDDNPLDMSGNVWEWCLSKFVDYPYSADDEREGVEGENVRVLRGGAFDFHGGGVRCASRFAFAPVDIFRGFGFRVAPPLSRSDTPPP